MCYGRNTQKRRWVSLGFMKKRLSWHAPSHFASKACIVMSTRVLDGMTLREGDTDNTADALDNLIADMFGKRFSCEKLMS